ncbi:hypothetical protein HPB50_008337 [Hyalomma asiaticum]|uniref:Uncharacterized protein n=1 Tax=Hyalomma asiaticum TaxID=266040 RepID=A0ACB7RQZ8_HYAAI|nr:hypothetical protein HPB50_008337 [Hyalomma asiaticum]
MDESPPPRMDSPPPDADNSGQSETDSGLVGLSPELPTSPHSRESSQSCDVRTDKSDVFPESSETKSEVETRDSAAKGTTEILPAGEGAQKDVTAGAASKDSSTVEEEQPSCCKDEHKPEKGGDSAEQASRTSPQSGTKAVMRAKVSTRTDISGRLSRGETIAGESASTRKDDPEPAEQKTSKIEPPAPCAERRQR